MGCPEVLHEVTVERRHRVEEVGAHGRLWEVVGCILQLAVELGHLIRELLLRGEGELGEALVHEVAPAGHEDGDARLVVGDTPHGLDVLGGLVDIMVARVAQHLLEGLARDALHEEGESGAQRVGEGLLDARCDERRDVGRLEGVGLGLCAGLELDLALNDGVELVVLQWGVELVLVEVEDVSELWQERVELGLGRMGDMWL